MRRRQLDVAWAAGLFEGEGCITARGKSSGELMLGSTDRDVVERFRQVVGCGAVRTECRRDPHQDLFRWKKTIRATQPAT